MLNRSKKSVLTTALGAVEEIVKPKPKASMTKKALIGAGIVSAAVTAVAILAEKNSES